LNKLNTFEKCLLLDALVKTGNRRDAERLAEHIRYQRDHTESTNDVEHQNRIFDIVLNLNMIKADGAPGAGGQPGFDMAFGEGANLMLNSAPPMDMYSNAAFGVGGASAAGGGFSFGSAQPYS